MPTTYNQTVTIGSASALTAVKQTGHIQPIATSGALTFGPQTTGTVLTQNMTVHAADAEAWKWGRTLLQNLTIHQTDAEKVTYHATLAQTFDIFQLFTRGFKATLTQNMTVHPTAALTLATYLLQNLTVQDSTAPVGNLMLALNENLNLTDAEILQGIYNGQLSENIFLTGLYISPSGTVTTWAINTRTNAVTEYTNYNFNSFAQRGLVYMAANSTGIYELDGDTDNGVSIIADIISGFNQMNGSKLSGLKGLYLAIRGGGQFFIKVIDGDGREYLYETRTQPGLMTSKVKVGKGLRSRYMAFELISTGQDFDLDDLTFIPMLSDRRV